MKCASNPSFAFFDANRVQLHVEVCKVSGKKNTAQLCCSGNFSFRHTVPCGLLRAALPLHHEKGKTGERINSEKGEQEKRKNRQKKVAIIDVHISIYTNI